MTETGGNVQDGHEEGNVTALTRTEEPDCGDPQTRLELLNVDKVAVKLKCLRNSF